MTAIEVHELSFSIGDSVLLPTTSFIRTGPGLVALTGANGAGKTTLLRVLAGRQLPTSGQCLVYGRTPYEFDSRFRATVASLIDTPPVARDLTLLEQLALVKVSWGSGQTGAFVDAQELLSRLTIEHLGGRFPYELSAGQLQLFAVALSLSRPFEVLLLDEPERHLDGGRVSSLLDVLDDYVTAGAVVVTATHRAEIISHCADRVDLDQSAMSP